MKGRFFQRRARGIWTSGIADPGIKNSVVAAPDGNEPKDAYAHPGFLLQVCRLGGGLQGKSLALGNSHTPTAAQSLSGLGVVVCHAAWDALVNSCNADPDSPATATGESCENIVNSYLQLTSTSGRGTVPANAVAAGLIDRLLSLESPATWGMPMAVPAVADDPATVTFTKSMDDAAFAAAVGKLVTWHGAHGSFVTHKRRITLLRLIAKSAQHHKLDKDQRPQPFLRRLNLLHQFWPVLFDDYAGGTTEDRLTVLRIYLRRRLFTRTFGKINFALKDEWLAYRKKFGATLYRYVRGKPALGAACGHSG